MECKEKFNDTELPSIDKFFSKLTDDDVSEDDYSHAQMVWKTFTIKNMGE